MLRLPRSPAFWLLSFLLWFGVLWILSSRSGDLRDLPTIPFLDKIAHFGYFLGGAGLLSAFLYTRSSGAISWPRIGLMVMLVIAIVGAIDEYHQTFTPGRSGNDPFDWLADITGGICGFLLFRRFHRWLRK